MVVAIAVAVTLFTVAGAVPKVTVAPVAKLAPLMVTAVPGVAPDGAIDVIAGAVLAVTVNCCVDVPVPLDVVTDTVPPAPAATVAVAVVAPLETLVAALPPTVTLVAPQRLVPVMVICVPIGPDSGAMLLIVGAPVLVQPPRQELGNVMVVVVPEAEALQLPEQVVPLTIIVCAVENVEMAKDASASVAKPSNFRSVLIMNLFLVKVVRGLNCECNKNLTYLFCDVIIYRAK
jgi:hypothetical protein